MAERPLQFLCGFTVGRRVQSDLELRVVGQAVARRSTTSEVPRARVWIGYRPRSDSADDPPPPKELGPYTWSVRAGELAITQEGDLPWAELTFPDMAVTGDRGVVGCQLLPRSGSAAARYLDCTQPVEAEPLEVVVGESIGFELAEVLTGLGRNAIDPFVRILDEFGWQVTGVGIGVREQVGAALGAGLAGVGMGVGGSLGVDEVALFRVDPFEFSGDVVPFYDTSLGARFSGLAAQVGPAVGVILCFELSRHGHRGEMRDGYAGPSVGFALQCMFGVSVAWSPSIEEGKSGWISFVYTAGLGVGARSFHTPGSDVDRTSGAPEFGLTLSRGAAVSMVNLLRPVVVQALDGGRSAFEEGLRALAAGVTSVLSVIDGVVSTVRSILDPTDWDMSVFPTSPVNDRQTMEEFRAAMSAAIQRTTPDVFLEEEARALTFVPVSRRVQDPALLGRVADALSRRVQALRAQGTPVVAEYVASTFDEVGYLAFLDYCYTWGVLVHRAGG